MEETVGTTKAAYLLNISLSRVNVLLKQGRIKGAKKESGFWKIPLFGGMPQVSECSRGLRGTWRRRCCQKPTQIHVNKNKIASNRNNNKNEPVIAIKQGSSTKYCHLAEIKGECKVVYQPDKPLSCGAVVWIEVVPDTVVIPQLFKPIKMAIA